MRDEIRKPKLGIALGSGASRGWSHIGVLKALLRAGIEPDIVCGTSVGAMIGAAYLTGRLRDLEDWVLGSTRTDVLRFFDLKLSQAGFVNTERMKRFIFDYVAEDDLRIEDLPRKFIAVATELETGREVWLRDGLLSEAIRASIALPGLFPAVREGDRWLVDGGLVNPVPVSACRELGADVVIAVNLNSDIIGKRRRRAEAAAEKEAQGLLASFRRQAREVSNSIFPGNGEKQAPPGIIYTVSSSVYIFQDRITRSRFETDPADVIVEPKVGDIGLLEFHRAAEAIGKGEEALAGVLDEIRRKLSDLSDERPLQERSL